MKEATSHAGHITYAPIGIIRSPHTIPEQTPAQLVYAKGCLGRAEIMPEYAEGLKHLDGFSHIIMIYHTAGSAQLTIESFLHDDERSRRVPDKRGSRSHGGL